MNENSFFEFRLQKTRPSREFLLRQTNSSDVRVESTAEQRADQLGVAAVLIGEVWKKRRSANERERLVSPRPACEPK